jgi:hypothetical protein
VDYLINLALGIAGSLIAAEIVFHHKRWCRRIIRAAAARIDDPAQSEIKLEEWLAALDEHVGVFAPFSHALGCWIGAPAVAAELKLPVPKKAPTDHGERIMRIKTERVTIEVKSEVSTRAIEPLLKATRDAMEVQLLKTWRDTLDTSERMTDTIEEAFKRSGQLSVAVSLAGLTGTIVSLLSLFFWR